MMIKKMLVITTAGVMLSGCFMGPMALLGPATSGFSTASLMQTGVTQSLSYMVKKTTGKSVSEHAFDIIGKDVLEQTYFPKSLNKNKDVLQQTSFPRSFDKRKIEFFSKK